MILFDCYGKISTFLLYATEYITLFFFQVLFWIISFY